MQKRLRRFLGACKWYLKSELPIGHGARAWEFRRNLREGSNFVIKPTLKCNLACDYCFLGTTRIDMAEGPQKKIKDVVVGDRILSWNGKEIVEATVSHVYHRQVQSVYKVTWGASTANKFYVTAEHPVFVKGTGWSEAQHLKPGDVLIRLTNSDRMRFNNPMYDKDIAHRASATAKQNGVGTNSCKEFLRNKTWEFIHNGHVVESVELITVETNQKAYVRLSGSKTTPVDVYNLGVSGTETYFAQSILVHNCSSEMPGSACWVEPGLEQDAVDWIKQFEEEIKPRYGGKIRQVGISGGEPFMYAEIVRLVDWFSVQRGLKVCIYSNLMVPLPKGFETWGFNPNVMIRATYHADSARIYGGSKSLEMFARNLAEYREHFVVYHQELDPTWTEFEGKRDPTFWGSLFRKLRKSEDQNRLPADLYGPDGSYYPRDEETNMAKYDAWRKECAGKVANPFRERLLRVKS